MSSLPHPTRKKSEVKYQLEDSPSCALLERGRVRIVPQFSCGAASAVAAKIILNEHPADVLIVNAFIQEEDADNRRFLLDCERWFGHPILVLRDEAYGASTHEVWRRERYIKGFRGAPCSSILKRKLLARVSRPDDVKVIGYTIEEQDRFTDLQENFPTETFRAPLIEKNLTKSDCLAIIDRAGILLPRMYRLGYSNANCIGCPKGGQNYWQRTTPRYQRHPKITEIRSANARCFYRRIERRDERKQKRERLYMSTAAHPLYFCPSTGWTRTPHSYLKLLRRRLTEKEHAILGVILADTIGAQGRPEWAQKPNSYYAYWANCSEDMAGRTLRRLETLGLVESRKRSKTREYRAVQENFSKPEERPRRTCERKSVQSETRIRPQLSPQTDGRTQGETTKNGFVDTEEVNQPVTDLAVGNQVSEKSSSSSPSKPSSSDRVRDIENFVTSTITPKLGSCPPKNIVESVDKTLRGAQNGMVMFEAGVYARLDSVTGWGLIPLLAQDARKAAFAVSRLPKRTDFDLTRHWESSRQVRRMIHDSNTPETVKTELFLMWPELRKSQVDDDARLVAKAMSANW